MAGLYVKAGADGEVQGPFPAAQLKRLAAGGKIKPDHLVSKDGKRWVRARKVKGLGFPARDQARDKNVCPSCGAAVEPGAVICTGCGVDLKTGRQLSPRVEVGRGADGSSVWKSPLLWVFVFILVAGGGGAFFLFGDALRESGPDSAVTKLAGKMGLGSRAGLVFSADVPLIVRAQVERDGNRIWKTVGETPGGNPLEIPKCRRWEVEPIPTNGQVDWEAVGRTVREKQIPGLRLPPGTTDERLASLEWLSVLHGLDLSATDLTDDGMSTVAKLNELRSLDLSTTRVTDDGLARLAGLPKLEELYLCWTPIGDAGLEYLKGLGNLRVLDLRMTQITDAGVGGHLVNCGSLEELWLPYQITDEGIHALRKLLDLRTLVLCCSLKGAADTEHAVIPSSITDEGLAHLEEVKSLQRLSLRGAQVTSEGLAHLEKLYDLRVLDLRETQVGEAAVEKLTDALGGLDIRRESVASEAAGAREEIRKSAAALADAQGATEEEESGDSAQPGALDEGRIGRMTETLETLSDGFTDRFLQHDWAQSKGGMNALMALINLLTSIRETGTVFALDGEAYTEMRKLDPEVETEVLARESANLLQKIEYYGDEKRQEELQRFARNVTTENLLYFRPEDDTPGLTSWKGSTRRPGRAVLGMGMGMGNVDINRPKLQLIESRRGPGRRALFIAPIGVGGRFTVEGVKTTPGSWGAVAGESVDRTTEPRQAAELDEPEADVNEEDTLVADAVELDVHFTPGSYKLTETSATQVHLMGQKNTQRTVISGDVEVSEPDESGEQTIRFICRRVQHNMSAGGQSMDFDSAAPAGENDATLAKLYGPFVGWKATIVARDDRIVRTNGVQSLMQRISAGLGAEVESQLEPMERMLEEFIKEMLTQHWAEAIPEGPVQVGEEWASVVALESVPLLGEATINWDCLLKDLRQAGGSRVAVLEFDYGTTIEEQALSLPQAAGKMQARAKEMQIAGSGQAEFDLELGMTTAAETQMEAGGSMVISSPDGQEVTLDLRVKTTMDSELRRTAADRTQP